MNKVADDILKKLESYSDRYGREAVSNEQIVYDYFMEVLENIRDEYGDDIDIDDYNSGFKRAMYDMFGV